MTLSRGSVPKRLVFLTGTRADYSKIKPLIDVLRDQKGIELNIFITGMHLLSQYGSTHLEVEAAGPWDYRFVNQGRDDDPHAIMAKTISGFGDYCREIRPDLIIVHGDRIEALAGAIVGVTTNTMVAHIEGGEVSGTIDDSFRHAITKLAHLHFVANHDASSRLIRLGENPATIFVIGSPELDIMDSPDLPELEEAKRWYEIPYDDYAIAILHPVFTERDLAHSQAQVFAEALERSGLNYVLIESNNDAGSGPMRDALRKLSTNPRIRSLPSMRFPYFLQLLKSANFIIGNSSSGVREAPHYGVPAINIGSRQNGRVQSRMVLDCRFETSEILFAISEARQMPRLRERNFGDGNSALKFREAVTSGTIWTTPLQKVFQDAKEVN